MNRKLTVASAIIALAAYLAFAGFAGWRVAEAWAAEESALAGSLEGLALRAAAMPNPAKAEALKALKASDPKILLAGFYAGASGWKYMSPAKSALLAGPTQLALLAARPGSQGAARGAASAFNLDPLQHRYFEIPIEGTELRLVAIGAVPSAEGVVPHLTLAFLAIFAVLVLIACELIISYLRAPREAASSARSGTSAAPAENAPSIDIPLGDDESSVDGDWEPRIDLPPVGMGKEKSVAPDEDFSIPLMEDEPLPELRDASPEPVRLPVLEEEAEEIMAHDASERPPEGLYSPASGLGWEAYFSERLRSELERAASFEQDLSLALLSMDGIERGGAEYRAIARVLVEFTSFRDLCFEHGETGFAAILPNSEVEQGLRMMEECMKKLTFELHALRPGTDARPPLFIGLSSRAGRLVDSRRLVDEACQALEKARSERDSSLIAFKPDADRFRQYLARDR